MSKAREFSIFFKSNHDKGWIECESVEPLPIPFKNEKVKAIELTPEVSRKLELFDELVEFLEDTLANPDSKESDLYDHYKDLLKRARGE